MDIVLAVRDNYLTDSDAFTGRQGMNVAFALTGFDSVRENILDPEYASIQFMYSQWEVLEDGEIWSDEFEVESHPCTEEELGLTPGDSKFMPIHESSLDYMKLYKEKFVCVNQDDLEIYGTFSSKKAKNFRMYLNRCHD